MAGDGIEDENEYTKWGTECHEIAARILQLGIIPKIPDNVDDDEAQKVIAARTYAIAVQKFANGNPIMVEQSLDFNHLLPPGTEDQRGTTDAAVIVPLEHMTVELQVHDLKAGMGVVVYAKDNEQLMIYSLSALQRFDMVADIVRIRMVIHQPRLGRVDEHVMTRAELLAFGREVAARIAEIEKGDDAEVPGDKQCRFCKRKTECRAYEQMVFDTVSGEFTDLTDPANMLTVALDATTEDALDMGDNRLAIALAAVPMIEQWCLAVRAKAEELLLANKTVPGFKLVRGRSGKRTWVNEHLAAKELKAMKLTQTQMFSMKLASPPAIEKLLKAGAIKDKQWKKLQDNITQSEGALSVAPASDARPAASVVASTSEFTDETAN